ncbi:ABC transporter permease [Antrihabitans cavernicola]|uniref:ABC transporter permease n=1 Tax=Antrihabitans cavernicola TaxID=2495913 RepID=A0A5A7SL25_9NOCA|nr:ABC transporter permease [Spelaeibacter cavernicola]
MIAFAWPAANIAPRHVPIGVAGSAEFVGQVTQKLDQVQPDAFDVTSYADPGQARSAIENREVYGAIVAGQPPTVLTAPAGSTAVAQILDTLGSQLGRAHGVAGPAPTSTQVVALPAGDPRGIGFSAGSLPMVLGALLTGVVATLIFSTIAQRLTTLTLAAVVAGLGAAAVLGPWLGILPGGFAITAGALALGIFAGGATIVGFSSLLGQPGIGVGAALLMVLGNPFSGVTSAPELLPTGWGELGQWLPPGALGSLLRSVSYFDGEGSGKPLAILAGWAVLGVGLAVIGAARRARVVDDHPNAHEQGVPARTILADASVRP